MVENNEVAGLEVETVQLVAGGFGVHDILVDDECSAFGVACDSLTDLAVVGVSGDLGNGGRVMGSDRGSERTEWRQTCRRGRRAPRWRRCRRGS